SPLNGDDAGLPFTEPPPVSSAAQCRSGGSDDGVTGRIWPVSCELGDGPSRPPSNGGVVSERPGPDGDPERRGPLRSVRAVEPVSLAPLRGAMRDVAPVSAEPLRVRPVSLVRAGGAAGGRAEGRAEPF